MYVSRMLSFVGCSFEKKDCVLNEADKALYDEAAFWWMKLHQGFEECERLTGNVLHAEARTLH